MELHLGQAGPDRLGSAQTMDGLGDQVIKIQGQIYPEIQAAGTWKIEAIAAQAGFGRPLSLILGNGLVLGRWCVEAISQKNAEYQSVAPSEIGFTISISKYSGGGIWPI